MKWLAANKSYDFKSHKPDSDGQSEGPKGRWSKPHLHENWLRQLHLFIASALEVIPPAPTVHCSSAHCLFFARLTEHFIHFRSQYVKASRSFSPISSKFFQILMTPPSFPGSTSDTHTSDSIKHIKICKKLFSCLQNPDIISHANSPTFDTSCTQP